MARVSTLFERINRAATWTARPPDAWVAAMARDERVPDGLLAGVLAVRDAELPNEYELHHPTCAVVSSELASAAPVVEVAQPVDVLTDLAAPDPHQVQDHTVQQMYTCPQCDGAWSLALFAALRGLEPLLFVREALDLARQTNDLDWDDPTALAAVMQIHGALAKVIGAHPVALAGVAEFDSVDLATWQVNEVSVELADALAAPDATDPLRVAAAQFERWANDELAQLRSGVAEQLHRWETFCARAADRTGWQVMLMVCGSRWQYAGVPASLSVPVAMAAASTRTSAALLALPTHLADKVLAVLDRAPWPADLGSPRSCDPGLAAVLMELMTPRLKAVTLEGGGCLNLVDALAVARAATRDDASAPDAGAVPAGTQVVA